MPVIYIFDTLTKKGRLFTAPFFVNNLSAVNYLNVKRKPKPKRPASKPEPWLS
jgi:hypothetical protein